MDQPANPQPLDYAPRPPGCRKRIVVRILLVVAVGTILGGWDFWGSQIERHFKLLYLQRECMTYVTPTNMPLDNPNAPNQPKAIMEFMGLMNHPLPLIHRPTIIFCHEVRASTGQPFLVIVYRNNNEVNPSIWFVAAGTLLSDPKFVYAYATDINVYNRKSGPVDDDWPMGFIPGPPPSGSSISAGQMDPADPTHFAYQWSWHDAKRVFEWRLREVDAHGVVHYEEREW